MYSGRVTHNKALVRTQTTLRFVCAAQLDRWALVENDFLAGKQTIEFLTCDKNVITMYSLSNEVYYANNSQNSDRQDW